ncbi:hypothetical protein CEUSTIGMA_g6891.t1 [Chlamydomonas eustigma]|uniref:AP2/ERF domain-containing protein n=1 Tax=Chlamydomonas eustigma TaxID=1157962 RepID=A0A250X9K0_9CHLO|nr:hypothetical protein CEUSTIGMA_g6891.t1 [Chlamydomonas eustigma]|eukprot:GAX79450.1 hypothetical protein CEUSTIGMA_g6891.t1 [Chlamydomonas eustigma]
MLSDSEQFPQQFFADAAAAAQRALQESEMFEHEEALERRRAQHVISSNRTQKHGSSELKETSCRNQTGYIGVRQRKWGMYAAEIRDGDKRRWLGSFHSGREAGMAYDAAAISQKGCKAKTNFKYDDFSSIPRPDAEHVENVRWELLPKEVAEKFPIPANPEGNGARDGVQTDSIVRPRPTPYKRGTVASRAEQDQEHAHAHDEPPAKRNRSNGGFTQQAVDPFTAANMYPASGHYADPSSTGVMDETAVAAWAASSAVAAAYYSAHYPHSVHASMMEHEGYVDPMEMYRGPMGMMDPNVMYEDATAVVVAQGRHGSKQKGDPSSGLPWPLQKQHWEDDVADTKAESAAGKGSAVPRARNHGIPGVYDYMNPNSYAAAFAAMPYNSYMMSHAYAHAGYGFDGKRHDSPASFSPREGGPKVASAEGDHVVRRRGTGDSLPGVSDAYPHRTGHLDRSPTPDVHGDDRQGSLLHYPESMASAYHGYEHLLHPSYSQSVYPHQAAAAPVQAQPSYTSTPGPTTGAVVRPRAVHAKPDYASLAEAAGGYHPGAFQPYQPGFSSYTDRGGLPTGYTGSLADVDDGDIAGVHASQEFLTQRWRDLASNINKFSGVAGTRGTSTHSAAEAGSTNDIHSMRMPAMSSAGAVSAGFVQEGAAAIVAAAAAAAQQHQHEERQN